MRRLGITGQVCGAADFESTAFSEWCTAMAVFPRLHRKTWEFVFIAEALRQRGLLKEGMRGLGFGVGEEPLVGLFVGKGATINATDLDENAPEAQVWRETGQHAMKLFQNESLVLAMLADRLRYRAVDMRAIPADLHDSADFVWSSCSLEHLGSLEEGLRFIVESARCLRPGGVAVHTTEFCLGETTLHHGGTVLYRRCDLEPLYEALPRVGAHLLPVDWSIGTLPLDQHIDVPPYGEPHLKLAVAGFVTTSIGLIVKRELA